MWYREYTASLSHLFRARGSARFQFFLCTFCPLYSINNGHMCSFRWLICNTCPRRIVSTFVLFQAFHLYYLKGCAACPYVAPVFAVVHASRRLLLFLVFTFLPVLSSSSSSSSTLLVCSLSVAYHSICDANAGIPMATHTFDHLSMAPTVTLSYAVYYTGIDLLACTTYVAIASCVVPASIF